MYVAATTKRMKTVAMQHVMELQPTRRDVAHKISLAVELHWSIVLQPFTIAHSPFNLPSSVHPILKYISENEIPASFSSRGLTLMMQILLHHPAY